MNSKYSATKTEIQILMTATQEYHRLPARSKARRELLHNTCLQLQKNAPKGNWNLKRTRQWFFNNNPTEKKEERNDNYDFKSNFEDFSIRNDFVDTNGEDNNTSLLDNFYPLLHETKIAEANSLSEQTQKDNYNNMLSTLSSLFLTSKEIIENEHKELDIEISSQIKQLSLITGNLFS